jgi:hypothetical protein
MKTRNLVIAGAALAAAFATTAASARDNVSFSISLGVPAPVYVAPAPAYYPPAPIYSSAPIYHAAPVYYYPPRVYVAPRVVYAPSLAPATVVTFGGNGHGHRDHHRHGHRWHR